MSSGGFHVHGPHDHELEHAVQLASHGEAGGGMINQIAMFTAVIATADRQPTCQAKIDRYEKEKKEIEAEARKPRKKCWNGACSASAPSASPSAP